MYHDWSSISSIIQTQQNLSLLLHKRAWLMLYYMVALYQLWTLYGHIKNILLLTVSSQDIVTLHYLLTKRGTLTQILKMPVNPCVSHTLTKSGTAPGLLVLMDLIVLTTSICPSAFICSIRDQRAMNVPVRPRPSLH